MRTYQMMGVAVTALGLLTACNGGGGPGPITREIPIGIYSGSLSNGTATDSVLVLLDANNVGVVLDQTNPVIYSLSGLSMSGSTLSASFLAFAETGGALPNGQTTDTGTITATLVPQSSLSGTLAFTGASTSSSFTTNYQATQTNIPATLGTIVGSYSFPLPTAAGTDTITLTIAVQSNNGVFTGTDGQGCTFNGTVGIPLASVNIYEIDGNEQCSSTTPPVTSSNLAFTGVMTFIPGSGSQPDTLDIEYNNNTDTGVSVVATRL